MSIYADRHTLLLQKAGVTSESLPSDLSLLIGNFHRVIIALHETDTSTQERLLYILVQADAAICAALFCLYKDRLQPTDIISTDVPDTEDAAKLDKIKLLAHKARALQLKSKSVKEN